MQTDIKATNIELTDAIRTAVQKHMDDLDTITARFGDVVRAEVEIGKTTEHHKKGEIYRAEIHVRLPGNLVYAEAEHEDLYAAINAAHKEARRQILANKEAYVDNKKHGPVKGE